MKRLTITLVSILFLFMTSQAGEKDSISLKNYNTLLVSGNFVVKLKQGDKPFLTIDYGDVPSDRITIEVINGQLKIETSGNLFSSTSQTPATIDLTFETIEEINCSAGASIVSNESIKANNLSLIAKYGGSMNLSIQADFLESKATQGSLITLSGTVKSIDFKSHTGGVINAKNLISQEAKASAHTGGKVNISVSQKLTAEAGTGGTIYYTGDPNKTSIKEDLGGKITSEDSSN